jgi:hypothetical protein
MTPEQAVNYLVNYESIDAGGLPEFTGSEIYPHGYKYASIYKVLQEAAAAGRSLGVSTKPEPPLDYQPPIDEYYTLLWSERGEMRRAAQWWAERMLVTPRPLQEKLALESDRKTNSGCCLLAETSIVASFHKANVTTRCSNSRFF